MPPSIPVLIDRGSRYRRLAVSAIVVLITAHTAFQFPGIKESIKDAAGIPRHVGMRTPHARAAAGRPLLGSSASRPPPAPTLALAAMRRAERRLASLTRQIGKRVGAQLAAALAPAVASASAGRGRGGC